MVTAQICRPCVSLRSARRYTNYRPECEPQRRCDLLDRGKDHGALRLNTPAHSSFPRIPVSPYQGFSLSTYHRINYRHGKSRSTRSLRVVAGEVSAHARVESKAAIPTQRRSGGNITPKWHKLVSGRTLASDPGRISQLGETWAARDNVYLRVWRAGKKRLDSQLISINSTQNGTEKNYGRVWQRTHTNARMHG